MNIVFGELVGDFTGYFTAGSGMTEEQFRASVNLNALYIFCLFLGKFVLGYVSIYAFRMSGIRISAAIRLAYLSSLFDLPVSVVDKLPAGEATDVLTNTANTIQLAISDKLGLMLQSLSLVISAYVIAFVYSWKLTLVSSAVIVFVFALLKLTMPRLMKGYVHIITKNAMASGVAGEVLRGIRTIKSLGAEEKALLWHSKHVNEAQECGSKLAIWVSMQFWPSFFAGYANMALTFWAGIMFYTNGLISGINALVIVLFSVLMVVSGVGGILTPLQSITKASSASVACFKIIDWPKPNCGGMQVPDVKPSEDIKFDDARFTYPSRPEAEVLKGINLTIRGGEVTALVGPSGCGKSTIIALLERWYDLSDINEKIPQPTAVPGTKNELAANPLDVSIFQNSGKILVGEHNLEEIDRKWWRSQIGLVQQEPVLFNETIFDNVAKGLIGSQWEETPKVEKLHMVKEACQEAFADDFIRKLPSGYDTVIGESGIRLSGGQRQRLAIARSIIKRPPILIFDEATSSIDARSEQLVTAALDRASKGRTTIIIAHRLSTIRRADRIIVLRDGTVVEEGTHSDLMIKDDGIYSDLVKASNLEIGDLKEEEASEHQDDCESQSLNQEPDITQNPGHQNPPRKTKEKIHFRAFGHLLSEQKRYYLLYFFALAGAIAAGATVPVQAWLFSHVVSVFNETDTAKLSSSGRFWSLMLFILAICAAISYATIGYFSTSISFNLSAEYRKSSFQDVLAKPIRWFDEDDNAVGSVTEQLGRDPQLLQELLGVNVAFPLIAVFNLIGCTIVSFVFGWKLSLVIFFASMPVILIAAFLRVRYEMLFVSMNEKVFAKSSKFAAEAITSFRTVTALTLEDTISKEYDTLLRSHIHEAFMSGRFSVLVFALSDSLQLCSMALAFWYGGQLLARREYEPLQFFLIYAALIQSAQAAGQFLAYGPNVANATAAANRILAYRQDSEMLSTRSDNEKREAHGCKLEFRNVGFRYPSRHVPVYKDLSFKVEPGQYVAFVGPSGCGKTTIVSLLERFYDVDSGAILINNKNITSISLSHYRSLCGLVAQEPTLFAGTVRENITLGIPAGTTTPQSDIDVACKAAEIYDFIISLPQGFDTPISAGTHSSFSGGQKQRLCIARALLRKPQLLLLDEATNSLDSVSEGLVQKAIEHLSGSGSLTILAVAHRLATVKRADRIFVMGEGGVVLEYGNHGDLIQKRGVYWDMCKAQALDQ
ncbi:P-loop containing nucleoside triphosphate hydrolase protein [Periconia macrospinosa]|uniref:P-loop containing nucleoside triphosphate hydrolase protein n=1 Tax=Periconia macrospinosa TaxID=97972 RepID=A0A2V1DZ74_9PLEO|nr:P-loop containing nucleoside triphosphate hydrolase protein [Periconia macrospinosa]